MSDGVFEARTARRQLFGTDRVVELLEANHAAFPGEILEHLKRAVADFTAGTPAEDDLTAVLVKRAPR